MYIILLQAIAERRILSVYKNDLVHAAAAFHPAASEGCTKCGICARQCPVGAIPMDDPSHTNNELCINCMGCVAACPANSRALPDAFLAMITQMLNQNASGYKKPSIFL